MNGLAWDQLLLIIGLIVAGVALVVVRRPLFAFWISAVEDWLPGTTPTLRSLHPRFTLGCWAHS